MKDLTLVIDCSALCYQVHFQMGHLSNNDIPTGTIYGFLGQLLQLGQRFETNQFIFCWDSKHSFRKEQFPDYKKRRQDNRTDEQKEAVKVLHEQFPILRRKILPKLGFNNNLLQPGCEADDLLAQIAFNKLGEYALITSDQDLYQCLLPNVWMYSLNKKETYTADDFRKQYGIQPFMWSEVKSLAGCSSDGVPGIPGIGEKKAIDFLLKKLKKDSVAYKKIKAAFTEVTIDERSLVDWTDDLVRLPHHKSTEPELVADSLSWKGFTQICCKYKFSSFLQGDMLDKWEEFFSRDFGQQSH